MLKKIENKDEKISLNEREFIQSALYEELRIDGRGMYDYREVSISFGEDYGRVELSIGKTKYVEFNRIYNMGNIFINFK